MALDILQAETDLHGRYRFEVSEVGILATPENLRLVCKDDRCIVSDSRMHPQKRLLRWAIQCHRPRNLRPRANETHLPTDNIEKLWKLIQLPSTQDPTHSREPWIVGGGRRRPQALSLAAHCSKFPHRKQDAASADSHSAIEDGGSLLQPDRNTNRQQERAQQPKRDHTNGQVKYALCHRAPHWPQIAPTEIGREGRDPAA